MVPARRAIVVIALVVIFAAPSSTATAAPGKCEAPILIDTVCEAGKTVGGAALGALGAPVRFAAGSAMDMITSWVSDSAQWLLKKVVGFIDSSTSPNLGAAWFRERYAFMVGLGALVMLPVLLLAAIRSVLAGDLSQLLRCFWPYLPAAILGTFVAVHLTQTMLVVTDRLSAAVASNIAGDTSRIFDSVGGTLSGSVGVADPMIPSFAIFLVTLVLIIGSFFVWLELLVRSAAVTVSVFFMPLILAAAVWSSAGSRIARRMIETLFALIVSKFVVVAVISLATAAMADPGGGGFGAVMGAVALMLMAAFAPFAIFKLIPVVESSAAHHLEGLRYRHQSQLYHRTNSNHVLAIMRSRMERGGARPRHASSDAAPAAAAAGAASVTIPAVAASAGRRAAASVSMEAQAPNAGRRSERPSSPTAESTAPPSASIARKPNQE